MSSFHPLSSITWEEILNTLVVLLKLFLHIAFILIGLHNWVFCLYPVMF